MGQGSARRYRFPNTSTSNPWTGRGGRPRQWTTERIEHDLRAMMDGRADFPAVKEFEAADNMALYRAINRTGGTRTWAQRLGINPPRRGRV